MALQNYQYDIIMREYSRRQAESARKALARRMEVIQKLPRMEAIDQEVASLGAGAVRATLSGSKDASANLSKKLALLSKERKLLLTQNGYPEDYLETPYTCPRCQDTGYIGSQKCMCFRNAEISLLYSQSNIRDVLEKESFSDFSLDFYSKQNKNKSTGLSERETAQKALEAAKRFVREFDTRYANLFLYGDTGVGKTFLSHCIAHELLQSAHCVIYFSSHDLFERLAGFAFSKDGSPDHTEDILNADLLIIDDLGTELVNSFVSSQLFLCVNERILREKPTIISTNLSLEEFSTTYSERTFSRIAGNYQMIKLLGKDIRVQKLFV